MRPIPYWLFAPPPTRLFNSVCKVGVHTLLTVTHLFTHFVDHPVGALFLVMHVSIMTPVMHNFWDMAAGSLEYVNEFTHFMQVRGQMPDACECALKTAYCLSSGCGLPPLFFSVIYYHW